MESIIEPVRYHRHMFGHGRSCVTAMNSSYCGPVLCAGNCFCCWACSAPSLAAARGVIPRPRARTAAETARDNEIFDAVLPHLISNVDFKPAVGDRAMEKRQIMFDDVTPGGASAVLVETSRLAVTWAVRSQLRDDTVRRNPPGHRISVAPYQPVNRNVVIRAWAIPMTTINWSLLTASRMRAGFVQPWLPGFTEDGQTALFGFFYGPEPHGGFGCYILIRENGRWKVKQRGQSAISTEALLSLCSSAGIDGLGSFLIQGVRSDAPRCRCSDTERRGIKRVRMQVFRGPVAFDFLSQSFLSSGSRIH